MYISHSTFSVMELLRTSTLALHEPQIVNHVASYHQTCMVFPQVYTRQILNKAEFRSQLTRPTPLQTSLTSSKLVTRRTHPFIYVFCGVVVSKMADVLRVCEQFVMVNLNIYLMFILQGVSVTYYKMYGIWSI